MAGKIVVNPPAMAANRVPQCEILLYECLADQITFQVEAAVVAWFRRIRTRSYMDGVRPLLQQSPRIYLLHRLNGCIRIHMPIQNQSANAVRYCEHPRQGHRAQCEVFKKSVQHQPIGFAL